MADTGGDTYAILHNEGSLYGDYGVSVTNTTLNLGITHSSGAISSVDLDGAVDGGWHHVAFTFSGSDLVAFLDGVLTESTSIAYEPTAAVGEVLYLGSFYGISNFFLGDLDQIRISEGALTSDQVYDYFIEGAVCGGRGINYAATASANASASYSSTYNSSQAIDSDLEGEVGSYWRLTNTSTGWVDFDLGESVLIETIEWLNINDGPITGNSGTADYRIGLSTNGNFVGEEWIIASGTGELEETPAWNTIGLVVPIEAQFIRFYVDSYYGTVGGLGEIAVYGY
jgi:hypothetical protein